MSLLLSAILADHPMAHVIVIDPHNEYTRAFGKAAEVINVDNLQLPFWLFDFEEAVGILVRGGTAQEQEAQALILKDAMIRARSALGQQMAAPSVVVRAGMRTNPALAATLATLGVPPFDKRD